MPLDHTHPDHDPLGHVGGATAPRSAGKRTLAERLPPARNGAAAPPATDAGDREAAPRWKDPTLAPGLSFIDSITGGAAPAIGTIPDEPVDGYGAADLHRRASLTEADRGAVQAALNQRVKDNHEAIGGFLRDYVEDGITLVARYVLSAEKEKDAITGLLKTALDAGSVALATTGVGAMAGKAVGVAAQVSKWVITTAAAKTTSAAVDKVVENKEKVSDEDGFDHVISTVSSHVGKVVEEMVVEMDQGLVDLGVRLGTVPLAELWRIRIPGRFVRPPRAAIKLAFAGAIASSHHRRGMPRNMFRGTDWVAVKDVEDGDNNIVRIGGMSRDGALEAGAATFQTRSDALQGEIGGKATLGALPGVAVHASFSPELGNGPVVRLLARLGHLAATSVDVHEFLAAYGGGAFSHSMRPLLITRNTAGLFGVKDGLLAEHLALYRWATGDDGLAALGHKVNPVHEGESSSQAELLSLPELATRVFQELGRPALQAAGAENFFHARLAGLPITASKR